LKKDGDRLSPSSEKSGSGPVRGGNERPGRKKGQWKAQVFRGEQARGTLCVWVAGKKAPPPKKKKKKKTARLKVLKAGLAGRWENT